jgi:hypothetical protein
MDTQHAGGNAAQDASTSERGHLAGEGPANDLLMAEFGIDYDGVDYGFHGYRYAQLTDAVAYARLLRSHPEQQDAGGPPRRARTITVPGEAEQALMASLGIAFEAGAFHFRGFRYDLLADAVSYARSYQKGPS